MFQDPTEERLEVQARLRPAGYVTLSESMQVMKLKRTLSAMLMKQRPNWAPAAIFVTSYSLRISPESSSLGPTPVSKPEALPPGYFAQFFALVSLKLPGLLPSISPMSPSIPVMPCPKSC